VVLSTGRLFTTADQLPKVHFTSQINMTVRCNS
jgi:hypothetical protein